MFVLIHEMRTSTLREAHLGSLVCECLLEPGLVEDIEQASNNAFSDGPLAEVLLSFKSMKRTEKSTP